MPRPIGEGLAEGAGLDEGHVGPGHDPLGADVGGFVLAEGEDAPGARGARVGLQALEMRVVPVDHRRAAGLEPGEDLAFGVGDAVDRAEVLDMDGLHRGDDRHVGPHHAGERRDLGGVVHADLEHAEGALARHAGEREGHAPMIVVGGYGGMRPALAGEHQTQGLLGTGLAHRSRHRDDRGRRAGAGRHP
jgi:hypothetical protein